MIPGQGRDRGKFRGNFDRKEVRMRDLGKERIERGEFRNKEIRRQTWKGGTEK